MTDNAGAPILRLRNPWLRNMLQTQWIGVLSLLVSLTTLVLTYFWKPDDLVAYFRFVNPGEIGTNQLHLNYIFSNAGKTPAFVEDVSITEVFYHSDAYSNTIPDMDICKRTYTPSFVASIPSNIQSKPIHFSEGWYAMFYRPKLVFVANTQSTFSSISIEADAQRAISTVYEMEAVDWSKFNVVLLCPVVRFFNSYGHPSTAICDGYQIDTLPMKNGGPNGTRGTPAGLARLLPTSGSNCHIDPF
jgi:hypothetical protein